MKNRICGGPQNHFPEIQNNCIYIVHNGMKTEKKQK
jgi:hypothetical protein